jgi:5-methylcytosine-specific restriction endonuclease McrA
VKPKECSYCGGEGHTAFLCYQRRKTDHLKRSKLRPESKASNTKRAILRNTFFANNPPDDKGGYTCYLQISPACPKWLAKEDVTLEHMRTRARHPELKYEVSNIAVSCQPCNKLKGHLDIDQLVEMYPRLSEYLTYTSDQPR